MAEPATNDSKMEIEGNTFSYPGLNVAKYVSNYGPRGRVNRLLIIMDKLPEHATTAALEALSEVQKISEDVEIFDRVHRRAKPWLEATAPDALQFDELVREQTRAAVRKETSRLDDEVQRWRNLNKDEQARLAYLDLADHFEKQGNFETALAKYMEAYDFADTHHQQVDLRVRICKASILANVLSHIKQYAPHILDSSEYRPTINQFQKLQGSLMIALGLFFLSKRDYDSAARYFVQCPVTDINRDFRDIISGETIGLYGALCAVVAYNRGMFEKRVIRNKVFQTYLQQSPKATALVQAYYNCQYADVTKSLNNLEVDLRIDLYLKDQAAEILSAVRGKAMVQFFSPFSAMGMDRMAEAFGVTIQELESELVNCISSGHIPAQIDSHNKVLLSVDRDEEGELFQEIQDKGQGWIRETKAMLLRMSMINNNVALQTREAFEDQTDDMGAFGMIGNLGNFLGRRRGI